MKYSNYIIGFLFLLFSSFMQAQTKTDKGSVNFKIKNAGMSIDGQFSAPICIIQFDPNDLSKSKFNGTIVSASINTNNNARDNHLRKEEYFDASKYPTIKIESTSITADGSGKYKANCNLTLKGITKSITLPFTYTDNNQSFSLEGSFTLNRRDYGIGSKSIILSDNATISIKVIGKK
jgi:polyisoprenoid-binding protein YceI